MEPSEWEQYEQLVGLFRYYLDLAAKTGSLYWLVTGGVVTITFTNAGQVGVEWALVVPILMSAAFVVALLLLRGGACELRDTLMDLADELALRLPVHGNILVWMIDGLILVLLVAILLLIGAFVAVR